MSINYAAFLLSVVVVGVAVVVVECTPQDDAVIACDPSSYPVVLTAMSGYVESINYPEPYDPNEDCRWLLSPEDVPNGYFLTLTLEYMNTTFSDALEFYVGDSDSGFPDFDWGGFLVDLVFGLDTQEALLKFETGTNEGQYEGFRLHYEFTDESPIQEQSEIACSVNDKPFVLNNYTGLIESLDYPRKYPGAPCEWLIDVPTEDVPDGIYLSAIEYDAANTLYIYEADNNDGSWSDFWADNSASGAVFMTPGNQLFLDFPFPADHAYIGFRLVYYQVDPACLSSEGVVIQIPDEGPQSGILTSPGYPYIVPEHTQCRWTIKAPEGQNLELTSDIVHLQENDDCQNEYLEVLDGEGDGAISLGRYCGNTTFDSIPSAGDTMQLYLRTMNHVDDAFIADGFHVTYSVL